MANPNIKDYGFGSPNRSKEFDDEVRKKGQAARKPGPRIWSKDKCIDELEDILVHLKRILREEAKVDTKTPVKAKREIIRDLNTMMNKILDFMRYLYPQTETKINLNIDTTAESVIERLKDYKEQRQNENVFVVGINKDES